MRIVPVPALLVLLLSACAGEEFVVNVVPEPEVLEILDGGLHPDQPSSLDIPTAWLIARNAASVRVISTAVPADRMDDETLDFFWQRADTTALSPVEDVDGRVRWEATLKRRADGRGLLYWFEAADDTGSVALPAERIEQPARVEAVPIELDFERPTWPALRTPKPCAADRERVYDGAEDEATLTPGAPFEIIKNPDLRPWRQAEAVLFNNESLSKGYGVEYEGQAYFFPQIVMLHHETSNQTMGDIFTVMSYCPLTDTGLIFDTGFDPNRLPKFHDFAPLGLFNSNLMVAIIDLPLSQRTAYSQMLAYGVGGPGSETCPPLLPSILVEFSAWRKMHPETLVLAGDEKLGSRYDYRTLPNPYREYWKNDEIRSGVARLDDRLPRKRRVMGVLDLVDPLAVELGNGEVVVNDVVGGVPVVVLGARGTAIALERVHPMTGETFELRRTSGTWQGLPLYEDDTAEPSLWTFEGIALQGPAAGERLAWMPSMSAFWFAWYAIYPETRLVQIGE